jgi:tetratricopeptide (TPR) repeat protein
MTHSHRTLTDPWTPARSITLVVICLMVGIAGGWFIRGSQGSTASGISGTSRVATSNASTAAPAPQAPSAIQLRGMADAQASPLLARLKADPQNPDLLTSIGNLYYDAKQYPIAIDYYGRVLKAKPSEADVRTDLATAYWYMGDADTAIAEFNRALTYEPQKANTLFNLGLVKWQGKMDAAGAVADWKKLLAANPKYEGRAEVERMIAEAKNGTAVKTANLR